MGGRRFTDRRRCLAGRRLYCENSPLARRYDLDAKVVLLGVGHSKNTSLHLAEYRAEWPGKRRLAQGSAITVDGRRTWVSYEELNASAPSVAPSPG